LRLRPSFAQAIPDHDAAALRLRLLGENLNAFRETKERIGLADARCPHHAAPA
jgi:hypothetical protein